MLSRVSFVSVGSAVPPLGTLASEFPSVEITTAPQPWPEAVCIDGADWYRASDDFGPFDRIGNRLDGAEPRSVCFTGDGEHLLRTAEEFLTRYQRFIQRRNSASSIPAFDAALNSHAALHELSKPIARADFDHALDTWQWLLRLEPDASLPLQLATLFHDIERLTSEADVRVEQHAPDYLAFKQAHARTRAELAYSILTQAGIDSGAVERDCVLIAQHERPESDPELALLNDADALSFFSLNSPGYFDYFGPEQARRKVAYTLRRLGAEQRDRIGRLRLRYDVWIVVQRELAAYRSQMQ